MKLADVVIVGGGVVGLLTGYRLSQRGLRVAVLAHDSVLPPASWAGGGILSPLFPWRYSDAVLALTQPALQRYTQLAMELQTSTGIDIEVVVSGLLMPAVREAENAMSWVARTGVEYQVAESHEDGAVQVLLPDVGQVRNPRLLKALRAWHQIHNSLHHGLVQQLSRKGTVWQVGTASETWQASAVLVAAGAWSRQLLAGFFPLPALVPVKGEMLLYPASVQAPKHIVLTDSGYVIPRRDGSMLVGSTLTEADFDQRPTQDAYRQLKRVAPLVWPRLAGLAPVAHWAGLRPGFCRDEPVLMEVPEHPGLFIGTGHFRNGLVSAPVSADFLSGLICRETPSLPLAPYSFSPSSSSSSLP